MDPSNPKAEVAFSLKSRKPVGQDAAPSSSDNNSKPDNNNQLNEDELLTDSDKKTKTAVKDLDCTTRRRACKNCVCGRAELEAKLEAEGKLPAEGEDGTNFQPPPGGCGSCSMGDAFRCATCPFRGKPAWTATTTTEGAVQLNLSDDV